jgi:site-specific DNA recombinase
LKSLPATFERAQAVCKARRETREKTQKHPHYLKGSVYCGQCRGRLGVMNARNRWDTIYPYFYCINRARQKNCQQSAVLIADVEAAVADWWAGVELSVERIAEIRSLVIAELDRHQHRQAAELARQHARVRELKNQQQKLIEARYADAIPLDLLKSEQERIGRELAGAGQIIERSSAEVAAVLRVVDEVLLLCADAHQLYLSAPPHIKRQLNQAVFKRFWVIDDAVAGAELAEPFTLFLADGFGPDMADATVRNNNASKAAARLEAPNPALDKQEPGSNITTLVELRGFEPLTPRCEQGSRPYGHPAASHPRR